MFSPRVEIRQNHLASSWTYEMLDRRQQEIAAQVREGAPGALLLSEVAPVITTGRRPCEEDLLLSPEVLHARGVEVYRTGRGGFATYHGPGQWVAFAVDRPQALVGDPRGIRRVVEGLLEAALESALPWRPDAEIRSGSETGVWSCRGKLASVGIQVSQGVILHGVALNGYRTETSFMGLKPCGLERPVDFLLPTADLGAFLVMRKALEQAILARFWNPRIHD